MEWYSLAIESGELQRHYLIMLKAPLENIVVCMQGNACPTSRATTPHYLNSSSNKPDGMPYALRLHYLFGKINDRFSYATKMLMKSLLGRNMLVYLGVYGLVPHGPRSWGLTSDKA